MTVKSRRLNSIHVTPVKPGQTPGSAVNCMSISYFDKYRSQYEFSKNSSCFLSRSSDRPSTTLASLVNASVIIQGCAVSKTLHIPISLPSQCGLNRQKNKTECCLPTLHQIAACAGRPIKAYHWPKLAGFFPPDPSNTHQSSRQRQIMKFCLKALWEESTASRCFLRSPMRT